MTKKKNMKKARKSAKKLMKARTEHRNENTKGVSLNPVRFSALEALGFKYFKGFSVEEAD